MSNASTAPGETGLNNLLARRSPLAREYGQLVRAEPSAELDTRIRQLAQASIAAAATAVPVAPTAVAGGQPKPPLVGSSPVGPTPVRPAPARKLATAVGPADEDDDDDDDDPRRSARPRWLIPAFIAAGVLMAAGVGYRFLGGMDHVPGDGTTMGADAGADASFARRARERRDAARASAARNTDQDADQDSDQDAEVVELDADQAAERPVLPPPPFFAPEMPQVEDLDAAIALIRKDLVVANQMAAIRAETAASGSVAAADAARAASTATSAATSTAVAAAVVIQPRERRLAKILELYDGGQHDLAADSLEIFLRDFSDDPITQRILARPP